LPWRKCLDASVFRPSIQCGCSLKRSGFRKVLFPPYRLLRRTASCRQCCPFIFGCKVRGDVKQLTDIEHLLFQPLASSSMIFPAKPFGIFLDRSQFGLLSSRMWVFGSVFMFWKFKLSEGQPSGKYRQLCSIISLRRSL